MSDWDAIEALFQPAMKTAGMTYRARVKMSGGTVDVDLTAFDRPDTRGFDGRVQSRDYEMEYVHTDLPRLKEGDAVTLLDANDEPIATEKFYVREPPTVSDNSRVVESRTGYFRRALLTKIKSP